MKHLNLKRILSILLSITLLLVAIPPMSIATSATTTTTDDGFVYEILNGTYCKITGYTGNDTEVIIPSELGGYIVQRIEDGAFKNNKTIEKVVLPETLETIGSSVFYGCTALTYIGFNNTLINIGDYMFYGCTSLEEITIPVGVTSIGSYAFSGCTKLMSVTFNFGLQSIGEYAFSGCTGLTEVNLPETLTTIYSYAFENCQFTSIDIPDSVTTMGARAFYYCTKLTDVGYPSGWTTVLDYYLNRSDYWSDGDEYYRSPFVGCTSLKTIVIDEGVTAIPKHAFRYQASIEEVVLPESLTSIGAYAFDGCTGLKTIDFPENLTAINDSAFYDCSGLKSITVPAGVTVINRYTFSGCTGLTDVTFNFGLQSIGEYAFSGCTGLTEVNLPETLTTIYSYAFENCQFTSIDIPDSVTTMGARAFYYCTKLTEVGYPSGWTTVLDYYLNRSDYWSDGDEYYRSPFVGCTSLKTIVIDEGVTAIPKHAFRYQTSIEEVILPESLTSIGAYAFDGCTGLKTIDFPENLTAINDSAFYDCSGLKSITVPAGVTVINRYTFSGCTGLTEVNLPETLKTIYSYAFENCQFTSIDIPDSVTTMGARAFYYCTKLTDVGYPSGWTTVLDYALNYSDYWSDGDEYYRSPFVGCTSLKTIVIDEGVTVIPKHAFRYQTSIEEVILPESLTSIGAYAFDGCSGLSTLNLPGSTKSIGNCAFYECKGFRMLNLNENLESIGSYAFYGCDGLLSLVLNEKLKTVSDYAFANCANLTAARVPKSVTSFGKNGFNNCPKLTIYCYSGSAAHMALENTSYKYFLLDEHEHEYAVTIETAATCTRGGSQIKTCTICGYNYIELVEPLGHIYSSSVTAPTCMEKGYTTYTCSRCNDTYKDNYVDALGHSYGEWHVETEPKCTTTGSKYRICSVCEHRDTETIAALGHSYESEIVEPTCTTYGYTTHTCSVCTYSYEDTYVSAKGHSYGDWFVDVEATILSEGSEHRVCSECDYTESQTIKRIEIDINKNSNYGLAIFTVVNAQTLAPISNAQLFVSTESDGENTFATDADGKVSIVLPIGKQTVSVYADGCLTRNTRVNITSGINNLPQIGLSDKPTYEAQITHHLMDIEEIKEAGIDTSASENQHVYQYELKLEFESEIDWSSIIAYFNADGTYLGGHYEPTEPEPSEPEQPTYTLHYHVDHDEMWHTWCKTVDVEEGSNVTLTYIPWRDNKDYLFDGWYEDPGYTKKIYSVEIKDYEDTGSYSTQIYGRWIYTGEPDKEEKTTPGIVVPLKNSEEVVTVYPVSEYFYLIIRGEVRWLKEMFDVEMLIINNSNTDTLDDLVATLTLPEGLSLATMVGDQQTLSKEIEHIAEGQNEVLHWYVRGDRAGSYDIEAQLKGTVMPFEEPIDDYFKAENQLQVWAGNALNLHFEFPDTAYYGEDYPMTITLTNVSNTTLYNVNHRVQIEQGMEIYYSDGTSKIKIEESAWESIGVKEFHPGDKIIIETSINTFFESEVIQYELEKLIGIVDDIEQLINAYKAVKTGLDIATGLVNAVSGASKAIELFISNPITGLESNLKLAEALKDKLGDFMLKYSKFDNATFDAIVKLANSGVGATLNIINQDPDEWLKNASKSDIEDLIKRFSALENSIVSDTSNEDIKNFDIYDSIRTLISAIPIKFALNRVIMMEDEDNTTQIPWSYSKTSVGPQYFGISNLGAHLMNILNVGMGKIYDDVMPSTLQLIPGLDDPFNTDTAKREIIATENELAQFKAKDATGKVCFKAYVVRNKQTSTKLKSKSLNLDTDFELTCDNKTAVYENGVLSFTGEGIISIKPTSLTGGTLYIEDSEGNTYIYDINVVEQHECTAGERQIVIAPSNDHDGFAVHQCPICKDIIEIETLSVQGCNGYHTFGEWSKETAPTCEICGVESRICSVCGNTEYRFSNAIGHNVTSWNTTKEATCLCEGEKTGICERCEESVSMPIEKTDHKQGEWSVINPATAFTEGTRELRCSDCQELLATEAIPMTKETFGYSESGENRFITGLPECVTPEMLIAHYKNMGFEVTVSDSEGHSVEYIGTGCSVSFGDSEYTVLLKGDVNGDGTIDIFDVLMMVNCLNGDEKLGEIYVEAGLIVSEEEIDIFDILAMVNYLNGDASLLDKTRMVG